MKRSLQLCAAAFVLALVPLAAHASTTFTANLTGTQETPATGSTATGKGTVVLNNAETSITYTVTFANLSSAQTAAHIHAPAAPGATASPLIDIGANGATAGTFTGTAAVTAQQVSDLRGGLWYFNVHSTNFPGGEIRGQVQPSILISEFRFRGTAGGNDEFIEIYNNSDASITVSVSDGSTGWAVVGANTAATPATSARFVIPNGTIIPPRGHYLGTNSGTSGYSLGGYPAGGTNATPTGATGNSTYASGIVDGGSIGLFRTSTTTNFIDGFRMDAVGFTAPTSGTASFVEGGGLTPAGGITTNGEYSFVRRQNTGLPQDTDNNQNDFEFVATDGGTFSTRVATLGAPGPENLAAPTQRNAQFKASLIEPQQSSSVAPNRVRDTAATGPNAAFGTLDIRRRFTNTTGQTITRLRFRVVDITTLNSTGAGASQADVRVLNSTDLTGVMTSLGTLTVLGTVVETPPAQAQGGGLNSSLTVALPGAGLAPGAPLDVHFLLGVVQNGTYRFLVNVEALPVAPGFAGAAAPAPTKTKTAPAGKY